MVLAMGLILKMPLKVMKSELLLCVNICLAVTWGQTDKPNADPLLCQEGTFLKHNPDGSSACVDCPDGTFMDQGRHTNLDCKPCTVYSEHADRVLEASACTNVSDSRITKCVPGFYVQDRDREHGCRPCRFCQLGVGCCEDASASSGPVMPNTTPIGHTSTSVTAAAIDNTSSAEFSNCTCKGHVIRVDGCLIGEFWNASCGEGRDTSLFHCAKCPEGGAHTHAGIHRNTSCGSRGDSSSSMSTILIAVPVCIISALLIVGLVVFWIRKRKERQEIENRNKAHEEDDMQKVRLNDIAGTETVDID